MPVNRCGRKPVLTDDRERVLADACTHFSLRGVPIVKEEIAELVQQAWGHLSRVWNRLTDGTPG